LEINSTYLIWLSLVSLRFVRNV